MYTMRCQQGSALVAQRYHEVATPANLTAWLQMDILAADKRVADANPAITFSPQNSLTFRPRANPSRRANPTQTNPNMAAMLSARTAMPVRCSPAQPAKRPQPRMISARAAGTVRAERLKLTFDTFPYLIRAFREPASPRVHSANIVMVEAILSELHQETLTGHSDGSNRPNQHLLRGSTYVRGQ